MGLGCGLGLGVRFSVFVRVRVRSRGRRWYRSARASRHEGGVGEDAGEVGEVVERVVVRLSEEASPGEGAQREAPPG